jgi:hypothetical protein
MNYWLDLPQEKVGNNIIKYKIEIFRLISFQLVGKDFV